MTKTVNLGNRRVEYTLERKRVKNLNMRISPDKGIYVSVRRGVPEAEIERFILSKSDFILKTLDGFEKREKAVPEKIEDGKTVLISGKRHSIRIEKGNNTVALSGDEIVVFAKDPENEEAKRKILEKFFKEYYGDSDSGDNSDFSENPFSDFGTEDNETDDEEGNSDSSQAEDFNNFGN